MVKYLGQSKGERLKEQIPFFCVVEYKEKHTAQDCSKDGGDSVNKPSEYCVEHNAGSQQMKYAKVYGSIGHKKYRHQGNRKSGGEDFYSPPHIIFAEHTGCTADEYKGCGKKRADE